MTRLERLAIPCLLTAVSVVGPVAALALAPNPAAGAPVLVIAPDPARLVEEAGGHVVGPRIARWAVLVEGGPEVIEALDASGAWLVRDGTRIAAICGLA